jgi:hypothetical protein
MGHAGPMGHRFRRVAAGEPEYLRPQSGRRGGDGQRGQRRQAEQQRRGQLAALPFGTRRAPLDVPVDPLAHQDVELPVPVLEQRAQRGAIGAARTGDEQRAQRDLQLITGPGQ